MPDEIVEREQWRQHEADIKAEHFESNKCYIDTLNVILSNP